MADMGFNKSTLTFASAAVGELRSLTDNVGGAVIDVGASDDAAVLSLVGRADVEVTAEIVGGSSLSYGDKGAIAITWFDDTVGSALTNAIVTAVSTTGSMDGEITTSLTFKETPA